jgi:Ca2+-binding RTX toxin-like protein
MAIHGTSGDDTLTGTSGNDVFDVEQGGNDTVSGLGGNDVFNFGAAFTSADSIDGGAGTDTLKLNGDYSGAVAFTATTMVNVEKIVVAAGHSYELSLVDANVAAGQTLSVDASALGAGDTLFFTDTSESDGGLSIKGGDGSDSILGGLHHTVISGGDGDDEAYLYGGLNIVNGGDGNDVINIEAPISSHSRFDGGTGGNQIFFNGDFSAGQTIGADWGANVGDMAVASGHNYKFTMQDGLVAAGQTLGFYANGLGAGNWLNMNASHLTQGNVYLQGGAGNDTLVGGAGNDGLEGRGGADKLTGGAGDNTFYYNNVAESTSSTFDRITDFNATNDRFQLQGTTVANIDTAVTGGTLTASNFDNKLAGAIGAAELHAGDAVLYTPSAGYLTGHILLVIDANGVAGYQAGADYVIDITGMTGTLTTDNFVT